MKRAPLVLLLTLAACGGDRPPPAPPPDPSEPFEDPVTSVGSGGVATTGPFMQNPPSLMAKSTEAATANGGTLGTTSSTTALGHEPDDGAGSIPHGPLGPEGPVGVGGTGAASTTAQLGNTGMGGRPPRGVTTDGSIR